MASSMSAKELSVELGISRSSLYYHPKKPEQDWEIKQEIEQVLRSHPSYGYRRVAIKLGRNKKQVQRVMQLFGIKARRRRPKWRKKADNAVVSADSSVYPNRLLSTTPTHPNHIWATDFTRIWYNKRWWYLCTMLDLYTRRITGYAFMGHHKTSLIVQALLNGLHHHGRPEILHSDQGSEYKSQTYQQILSYLGIQGSMSAKACPWENGYQESFYNQFKIDLGDPARFQGLGELVYSIQRQLYRYNNERIHSALSMSPNQFHQQHLLTNQSLTGV